MRRAFLPFVLLLVLMASPSVAPAAGRSPLWKEIGSSDLGRVQAALAACSAGGNCAINEPDSRGFTLLHTAVLLQRLDVARLLLEAGAEVETHSEKGCTPLQDAVAAGHREAAEVLLAWGADPAAEDAAGMSAIRIAELSGRTSLLEELRRHEKKGFRVRVDPRIVAVALMIASFVAGVAGFAYRRQRRVNLRMHGSEYADAGFSIWRQDRPDHLRPRADVAAAGPATASLSETTPS